MEMKVVYKHWSGREMHVQEIIKGGNFAVCGSLSGSDRGSLKIMQYCASLVSESEPAALSRTMGPPYQPQSSRRCKRLGVVRARRRVNRQWRL